MENGMIIRKTCVDDAEGLSAYFLKNTEHFRVWEPARAYGVHAVQAWRQRLEEREKAHQNLEAAYFVALDDDANVLGHCSLTNVMYGAFQACYMGYGVSYEFQGKGVMFALCTDVIKYAFGELGLHRIMANYMPHNERSEKLLKRLGFQREGYAEKYLQINGKWEDHVLTSLINPIHK